MAMLQNISGENENIEKWKNQFAANERSWYASQAGDERGSSKLQENGEKLPDASFKMLAPIFCKKMVRKLRY